MSIKTIADLSTPLNTYTDHLQRCSNELYDRLVSYYDGDTGLKRCSQVNLDGEGNLSINIPAVKFYCLSRQRLVFIEKKLVSEVEFFISDKNDEISVLKCFLDFDGGLKFDDQEGETLDFYNDPYLPSKILGRLFSAASNKKIISI